MVVQVHARHGAPPGTVGGALAEAEPCAQDSNRRNGVRHISATCTLGEALSVGQFSSVIESNQVDSTGVGLRRVPAYI